MTKIPNMEKLDTERYTYYTRERMHRAKWQLEEKKRTGQSDRYTNTNMYAFV